MDLQANYDRAKLALDEARVAVQPLQQRIVELEGEIAQIRATIDTQMRPARVALAHAYSRTFAPWERDHSLPDTETWVRWALTRENFTHRAIIQMSPRGRWVLRVFNTPIEKFFAEGVDQTRAMELADEILQGEGFTLTWGIEVPGTSGAYSVGALHFGPPPVS